MTFILLPGATIDTKGGGTFTLTGPTTAPSTSSLPAALQSYAGLFQIHGDLLMLQRRAVQFGGNSNINLTGNIYAPNAAVTFQGNPTIDVGGGKGCGELIAKSVAFNGNATLNSNGCSRQRSLTASMCSWCNDEKARSARRRGAGILPCRRAAFHIDVRHLRSGTLCNHYAVIADARECWRSGNNDQRLLLQMP